MLYLRIENFELGDNVSQFLGLATAVELADADGGQLRLCVDCCDAAYWLDRLSMYDAEIVDNNGDSAEVCDQCNEYTDSGVSDPDGNAICEQCFEDECVTCTATDAIIWQRDSLTDPSGDIVCEDYFVDNCTECCNCGTTIWIDDSCTTGYGDTYCESCFPENNVQFFDGVRKEFSGDNSFGSSRTFGVELETQSGRFPENYAFAGKDDGSTSGTECVSHKLRGDEGLKEIEDFINYSSDVDYDGDCGFHLHINMKDMSDDELYAVAYAYAVSDTYWKGHISPDRDDTSYSRDFSETEVRNITASYRVGRDFKEFTYNLDRYRWMNYSAYRKFGSFECRAHHATFDYKEIESWIIRHLRFVKKARHLRIEPSDTDSSFRRKVQSCIDYADAYFTPQLATA